ncbi:MAG: dienelactone hydrolase family protein [Acidimicrobiales bacterium]
MVSTRTETVPTESGSFAGHVALPPSGSGPGLLVLQEIFGVNTYIRSVCERVAEMGYVALAPDMFWRQEPGFVVEPDQGEEGMQSAFAKMGGFDWGAGAADLAAAFDHLQGLPECTGPAGVMGFCFGGTLTFHAAADLDPACAVSYYGSGVADALDAKADAVTCPILFHFGDDDPFLPYENVERVAARFENAPNVTVEVQAGAGHAFDNNVNPMFSNPTAAANAWSITAEHLARHLPVG